MWILLTIKWFDIKLWLFGSIEPNESNTTHIATSIGKVWISLSCNLLCVFIVWDLNCASLCGREWVARLDSVLPTRPGRIFHSVEPSRFVPPDQASMSLKPQNHLIAFHFTFYNQTRYKTLLKGWKRSERLQLNRFESHMCVIPHHISNASSSCVHGN